MPKKILVTGSIAYDVLLSYDGSFAAALKGADMDHLSVSFFSPHYARHHGGNAANIAWNLRLLGQSPLIVGTVGNDGGEYTALLEERGIPCSYVQKLPEHATATAIIGTDDQERQIMFYHPGADAHGSWPDKKLMDERDDVAYAIVSPRNAVLMMEAARFYTAAKLPWIFDPGQQLIALSADELLWSVTNSNGVVVNDYEWGQLSERTKLSTDAFLKINPLLVVTHGEKGLTIHSRGKKHSIPACGIDQLVNPTGAGDALRAGLLTGLVVGWELPEAGMLGASLASFVVEQEGTLLEDVDMDEVRERARQTYGQELP